jgi:hypothetical protein
MQAEKQCNYRRCFKKFTNLIARERTHTERPSHKLRLKICVVFFLPAQNSKEKERKDFLYGELHLRMENLLNVNPVKISTLTLTRMTS